MKFNKYLFNNLNINYLKIKVNKQNNLSYYIFFYNYKIK